MYATVKASQTPLAQSRDLVHRRLADWDADRDSPGRDANTIGSNGTESEVDNDSNHHSNRGGIDSDGDDDPLPETSEENRRATASSHPGDPDDHRRGDESAAAEAIEDDEIDYAAIPFDFVDSLPHGGKPGKPGRQFRKRWKRRKRNGEYVRLDNGRVAIKTKTYKWVNHSTWKTLKRYAKQPEVICEKIEQWEKGREGKRDN